MAGSSFGGSEEGFFSEINITPLVGCTLALWGILTLPPAEPRVIDTGALAAEMRARGEL